MVFITGFGFAGATDVRFGEKSGTALTYGNDTYINVTTPPNPAGTVAISVITPSGIIRSRSPSTMFQYEEVLLPRVTGCDPPSGPVAGNTEVIVRGSGFSGAESVKFGDEYAWMDKVIDDSHIRVRTPSLSPGRVPVTVKNAAGTGISQTPDAMFLFEYPVPELADISPVSGSVDGGTVVTVYGSGFSGATNVTFGGVEGRSLCIFDDRQLTIVSPPNPAGTVALSVINPSRSGSSGRSDAMFRYRVPLPELYGIIPPSGTVNGGTLVIITGTGFNGTRDIRFGGKHGTGINVLNDTHVTVLAPASSPGSVQVMVENAAGSGSSRGPSTLFEYIAFPQNVSTTAAAKSTPAGGAAGPERSLPPAAPPTPSGTTAAVPAMTHAPGFDAAAGLSISGIAVLLRRTRLPDT